MTFNKEKDLMSAWLHLLGLGLSIAGTVLLIIRGAGMTPWHVVSYAIFGATMIALYAASSTYHLFYISDKVHGILRKIDHIMIFMLIAGTYTPICLVTLHGAWGWVLFGIVWACALGGLFIKIFWMDAPRWLSTVFYIAMGWVCIMAIRQIVAALTPAAFTWLLAGGIIYTIGGVIYALKLPIFNSKHKNFGSHEIFHLFVMGGSFCHYMMMYGYVAAA